MHHESRGTIRIHINKYHHYIWQNRDYQILPVSHCEDIGVRDGRERHKEEGNWVGRRKGSRAVQEQEKPMGVVNMI